MIYKSYVDFDGLTFKIMPEFFFAQKNNFAFVFPQLRL